MILIKNGRVIDPASGFDGHTNIMIHNHKIEALGSFCDEENCEQVIDASNMIVTPGFVDIHVHFRDPGFTHKEDLQTGALAAARGGFTKVVCMANTKPVMDDVNLLKDTMKRTEKLPIHVQFASAISKGFQGTELVDMGKMKEAGAVCFSDDGLPLKDDEFVEKAMAEAKKLDMVLSFHEEDPAFVEEAGINHGSIASFMGYYGADREAEISMVKRDIALAKKTGAAINVQHISSKEAVELIRQAKKEGVDVSAEASPHHFTLTQEAILDHGALAKMNPPLREESDRLAIIEGLKDHTIDIIATDHAPHTKEEKQQDFVKAPSGIIGLETSLALGITTLIKEKHLTLMELLAKMNYFPAKRIGNHTSQIKVGYPADLVIFDKDEPWVVQDFSSKASNSPFLNETLYGKVKYTICDGNIVYQDKK